MQVPSEAVDAVSDTENGDSTHTIEHGPTTNFGSEVAANTKV
ncbi:hypothetical protein BZL39_A09030 [Zygosaccharomyces parabailii]|nr:hypothetical protein BZL39_A09030 [Zygosaccharomyces parabailii]